MPRKATGAASRLARKATEHIDIADVKKASRHADAPGTLHPTRVDAPKVPDLAPSVPNNHGYNRRPGSTPTTSTTPFTQSQGSGARLGKKHGQRLP